MPTSEIPGKVLRKRTSKQNKKIRKFIQLDKLTNIHKKRKYRRRNLQNSKKSQHKKKIDPATKKSLEYFWKINEESYFPQKSSKFIENINQIHQILAEPQEDGTQAFSNFECYLSFEKLISEDYGNNIKDSELKKANMQNLIDMYRISTLPVDQIDLNSVNIPTLQDELESWRKFAPQISSKKANKKTKYFLLEERTVIKRIQKQIGLKNHRKVSPSSELYAKSIDKMLEQTEKEWSQQRHENNNNFEEVKRKCFLEVREERKKIASKETQGRSPSNQYIEMKYLRDELASIEDIQMAESIKYVIAANRLEGQEQLYYCLALDEALVGEVVWVTEHELEHLETLRKAKIGSLAETETSEIVYTRPSEEIGWREIFEDKVNSTDSEETRKKILKKNNEYRMCHFCRKIELKNKLRVCRYNSTNSGFPKNHPNNVDPLVLDTHKQVPFTNEFSKKRNQFSFYKRKGHGLVCERRYCDTCLSSWFGSQGKEIKGGWMCPFCTGDCYCTRCNRNSNMIRIAELYLKQGGNLDEVKRESMLEMHCFKYDNSQINLFYTNIEILIPASEEPVKELLLLDDSSDSENTKIFKKKVKLQKNVKKLKEKVLETVEKEKKCHYDLIIEIQTFDDQINEAQKEEIELSVNIKRNMEYEPEYDLNEEINKKIKTNSSSPKKISSRKSSMTKDDLKNVPIQMSYFDGCINEGSESLIIPINQ